jgi:acyl-CoA thioester hydrolase
MVIKNTYCAAIDFEVKTYDIDIAGHLNNIVYIRWLEELRMKLFGQIIPLKRLLENDCFPFVISTSIDYKKQIKLFEHCIGEMILDRVKHFIWVLKTTFKVDNKVAACAVQKCVIVNLLTNKIQKPDLFVKEI